MSSTEEGPSNFVARRDGKRCGQCLRGGHSRLVNPTLLGKEFGPVLAKDGIRSGKPKRPSVGAGLAWNWQPLAGTRDSDTWLAGFLAHHRLPCAVQLLDRFDSAVVIGLQAGVEKLIGVE